MSKKSVAAIVLLIVSPVFIYFVWPSDEGRIRKLFREGASAVEQEKSGEVMSRVSFTYADEKGLTYILIKDGMERMFGEMSGIKIEYDITGMEIKDGKATAEVDLRIIGTRGNDTGYFVGDAGKPAHIKFFLKKERTKWLITGSEGAPTFE